MAIKPWEVISEEDISPSHWLPLFKQKIKLPDSKIVGDYYLTKLGAVGTMLLLTKENEILFIRQYKHGAGRILLELPAGRADAEDKNIEETVKRELFEETGYIANTVELIAEITPSPTKDTTMVHGFLCRDYSQTQERHFDVSEEMENVLIPMKDIKKLILEREIIGSDVIAILLIASLKYPEIFNYNDGQN